MTSPAEIPLPAPRRGTPSDLPREHVDACVLAALEEDLGAMDPGAGDLLAGDRTAAEIPEGARARARLVCKAPGVLAGRVLFGRAFELLDPRARVAWSAADGDRIEPGQELATVEGDARALLGAERTALNFLQRLSGVATLTRRFVDAVAPVPGARVLDTRKTTPGLRRLEKHAVRCGGGENHRFGLFDEVMVKENHIDLAGRPLVELLADLRARHGAGVRVTAEARDLAEARDAVRGGADVVLLDNFAAADLPAVCEELRALAREVGRPVELEASGGVTLDTVAAFAEAGVDRISVGALTHSAPALDLSLYLEPA